VNPEDLKVPPHSVEAEQSVLGGLLLDNQAWDSIADTLSEGDFYQPHHRLIFRSIQDLVTRSVPVDAVTLSERLDQEGLLDKAGGLSYLADLVKNTPSAANIAAYADIVRERGLRRNLITVGSKISDSAFEGGGKSVNNLVDHAEQLVFSIAEKGGGERQSFVPLSNFLTKAAERIDHLYHNPNAVTGVPTGYTDFDAKTAGLQPSDLIVIAGRPAMGKTSFAMNLVENAALNNNESVAVFSLEMPGDQLATRLISSFSRIDQHKLRTGTLSEDDWPRVTSAVNILSESKIFIDDSAGLSPMEIRAKARRLKREHGLGLIVIDYIQLMDSPEGSTENRATAISAISRALKSLAKELNVPVIALSQLNRSLENRPNKRPIMSDLRESGAIEQDADMIVFVYRDEVYNDDSPDKGLAEIIIGKQRNGPIGTVKLTFLGHLTRFENYSADVYLQNSVVE
jgi:replicative DNA helicase